MAVETHEMNHALGLYNFCLRFYSGYRAWQLWPDCKHLDVVQAYVAKHGLNTRKQTPAAQLTTLTGQRAPPRGARRA